MGTDSLVLVSLYTLHMKVGSADETDDRNEPRMKKSYPKATINSHWKEDRKFQRNPDFTM